VAVDVSVGVANIKGEGVNDGVIKMGTNGSVGVNDGVAVG